MNRITLVSAHKIRAGPDEETSAAASDTPNNAF